MATRTPKYKPLFYRSNKEYISLSIAPCSINNDLVVYLNENGTADLVTKSKHEHIFASTAKAKEPRAPLRKLGYTKMHRFPNLSDVVGFLCSKNYIICSDVVSLETMLA